MQGLPSHGKLRTCNEVNIILNVFTDYNLLILICTIMTLLSTLFFILGFILYVTDRQNRYCYNFCHYG